jgi:hypothetical protein
MYTHEDAEVAEIPLSCDTPPALKKRIERISSVEVGLVVMRGIVDLATSASENPEYEGTGPDKLEEQIWRELDRLVVRLNEIYGYDFSLNFNYRGEGFKIDLPLGLDFRKLKASVGLRNGSYHFRPFFKSPAHSNQPKYQFDDTHAVDFIVPEGLSVKSVSNGLVVSKQLNSTGGGNSPKYAGKDNYLYVRDPQIGLTFAYRHLALSSKKIQQELAMSTQVKKHQKLGEVGMTGWTSIPHLHFSVYETIMVSGKPFLRSLKLTFASK